MKIKHDIYNINFNTINYSSINIKTSKKYKNIMDHLFHNRNYKYNTFNNILKRVGYFNQVSPTETH